MSVETTPPKPDAAFDRETVLVIAAILTGGLTVLLDSTIVSVALKSLAVDLSASVTTIQWVSTGYLLAVGTTIPLAAWAQGRWGGRKLWLTGLVLFGAGSIGASLAGNVGWLIAARGIQGVGGGILMPLMATLPMQAAKGKVTGRMISMVTLPMLVGPMLGPVIGGLILHWLSWRWLFWVNVPILLIGFVAAWRVLPADDGMSRKKLDLIGVVLLPPGLVGLLYGLSKVSGAGGFDHAEVLWPLIAGAGLIALFGWHAVRRGAAALVDLSLLTHRQVASTCALMFISGAGLFGGMFLLPLYWQIGRNHGVLEAGLLMVPQGVGSLFSRPIVGSLTDRIGARPIAFAGLAVVTLATVPFAVADLDVSSWWMCAALVVRGIGLGAVMIPIMAVAYRGLVGEDVAHASVLTRVSQQVGGSFGTALLAVVLEHSLTSTGSAADAFHHSFWWAVALSALGAAAVPTLPRKE